MPVCSQCELAVDAVHKRSEEDGSAPPRREDITDTMVFTPSDLVTMTCRDVDLNFATRGINTRMEFKAKQIFLVKKNRLLLTEVPKFHFCRQAIKKLHVIKTKNDFDN